MDRLLLALVLVAVAVAVAVALQRRAPDAPTQGSWNVPAQLDRADFPSPDVPWLLAVFTSATCRTCAGVLRTATELTDDDVVVFEAEVSERGDLHRRYGIDAVPTVVIVDAAGEVRASHIGPVGEGELRATLSSLRSGPSERGAPCERGDPPDGVVS